MLCLLMEFREPWCASKKGLTGSVERIQLKDDSPDVRQSSEGALRRCYRGGYE